MMILLLSFTHPPLSCRELSLLLRTMPGFASKIQDAAARCRVQRQDADAAEMRHAVRGYRLPRLDAFSDDDDPYNGYGSS